MTLLQNQPQSKIPLFFNFVRREVGGDFVSLAIRLDVIPETVWCLLNSTDKSTCRLDAVEDGKIAFLLTEIDTTLPTPYPNNIPYICTYIQNAVSYITHMLNYQYQFKCSIENVLFIFSRFKIFHRQFSQNWY